jgi:hypothetical protein
VVVVVEMWVCFEDLGAMEIRSDVGAWAGGRVADKRLSALPR